MASSSSKLFLGLDSSTQGLSARVIDEHLQEQSYSVNINYFEKYGSDYDLNASGVIKHGKRVVQPTELVRIPRRVNHSSDNWVKQTVLLRVA